MPLALMIRPLKVIELNPFSSLNNQENTEFLNVYRPIRAYHLWVLLRVVHVCDELIKLMSLCIMRLSLNVGRR